MDTNQAVAELSNEMWERVLGINLNGPMFLSRKAVPIMLAQGGGSIVNTAQWPGSVEAWRVSHTRSPNTALSA